MFVGLLQYLLLFFFFGFGPFTEVVRQFHQHSLKRTKFWQAQGKLKQFFSSLFFWSPVFCLYSIVWLRLPFAIWYNSITIDRVQKNQKLSQFPWLEVCEILAGYLKFELFWLEKEANLFPHQQSLFHLKVFPNHSIFQKSITMTILLKFAVLVGFLRCFPYVFITVVKDFWFEY